ncbi:MAG: hypothetical protein ACTSXP_19170, partial [Promethearchaeota archaeon]
WKITRLDYLFSVVIPCLLAIYLNRAQITLLDNLKTIFGWIFLGIGGNVINDILDRDRDLGWRKKDLLAVSISSIFLGFILFSEIFIKNMLNIILVLGSVILVLAYCVKLKKIPFASSFVQVFAEIVLPYFTIHVPSDNIEWLWLGGLYTFSVLSQMVHESIDGEAITRYSPRAIQIIMILLSITTIGIGAIIFIFTLDYIIIPFSFVPMATIYTYRKPKKSPNKRIKDVGIIIGNLFMVYIIILIITS